MKLKTMPLLLAIVLAFSCKTESKAKEQTNEIVAESVETEAEVNESNESSESLNEIRFERFQSNMDWMDNEYIRALRSHLNACASGEINEACLEAYPEFAKGKIGIMQSEPFLMGGLFVYFFFVEDPNLVFNANVYSDVDPETRVVSGYRVLSMSKGDMETGLTKEEVLNMAKENPDHKLW